MSSRSRSMKTHMPTLIFIITAILAISGHAMVLKHGAQAEHRSEAALEPRQAIPYVAATGTGSAVQCSDGQVCTLSAAIVPDTDRVVLVHEQLSKSESGVEAEAEAEAEKVRVPSEGVGESYRKKRSRGRRGRGGRGGRGGCVPRVKDKEQKKEHEKRDDESSGYADKDGGAAHMGNQGHMNATVNTTGPALSGPPQRAAAMIVLDSNSTNEDYGRATGWIFLWNVLAILGLLLIVGLLACCCGGR